MDKLNSNLPSTTIHSLESPRSWNLDHLTPTFHKHSTWLAVAPLWFFLLAVSVMNALQLRISQPLSLHQPSSADLLSIFVTLGIHRKDRSNAPRQPLTR
ncbi:hypothetical protein HYPSUDRAFT_862087 [Hypholoma sublateritium FD-334 SS-4]|uniref:Uncharacterized protein n=1 Tax=Hypholoma sublateritium (strain FD-334 SS-4) TaxID=945553 RepID=A0A0D2MU97_HYPSF|nr:hypothetical protein HYPSUDRAFT_862087 [Hypholoma sublateritium FD-334 SS-4]